MRITSILLLLCITILSCTRKESKEKLWIFQLGESKEVVVANLKDKGIDYVDEGNYLHTDLRANSSHIIEYADAEWSDFNANFDDSRLKSAYLTYMFYKMPKGFLFNTDGVVAYLDKQFGKHTKQVLDIDEPSNFIKGKAITYKWETSEAVVNFGYGTSDSEIVSATLGIQYIDDTANDPI